MATVDVNFAAVLVSALASMVVGAIWYSPALFAKPWMELTGRRDMNPAEGAAVGYTTAAAGSLITAYILAHFVSYAGAVTAMDGAITGAWAWLGFNGVSMLTTYTFAARPRKLWAIDSLQYLVVFVVMGMILAVWH
ncbi:MAG TPA: DUF1761 domain-containing protein [Candidatus Saccharimonadales bacterium]|nr:DUF1761 domain-containing protein [Candidatus Saccharimonadales bacterium]